MNRFPKTCWLPLALSGSCACMALIRLLGGMSEKVFQAQTMTHLKQIGQRVQRHTRDNSETMPPMRTLRELKKALNQPLADTAWQTPGWNLPYAVNAAVSQKKLTELGNLGERVVVYEPIALWKRVKGGMEPGRAVLFADGHVKFLSQPEWDAAKKASLLPEAPAPEVAPWWHLAAAGPREPISDSRAALLWGCGYIFLALLAALLRRQRLLTGAVLFTLLGGLLGIGGFLLVVNGVRRGPGL